MSSVGAEALIHIFAWAAACVFAAIIFAKE